MWAPVGKPQGWCTSPRPATTRGPRGKKRRVTGTKGGLGTGAGPQSCGAQPVCSDPHGRICGDKYPNALLLLPLPGLLLEGMETEAAKAMGAPRPRPMQAEGVSLCAQSRWRRVESRPDGQTGHTGTANEALFHILVTCFPLNVFRFLKISCNKANYTLGV